MWNGLRVSYIQFHYLSLSLEPITWRASPLGVCDSNLSGACGGLTLSGCRPPPPHHMTLPLSPLLCPSLSLHSSKQGQLRTELAPCLHLKPPPITALWHPHQHKHVDSPSPFPSLSLGYPPGERKGWLFWSHFVWRDVRMEVLMEEKYLGHRWIRCWIRRSGKRSKFPSSIYRKQLFMNKRSAAALPGLLGLSEKCCFRLALHSDWAGNDKNGCLWGWNILSFCIFPSLSMDQGKFRIWHKYDLYILATVTTIRSTQD